MKMKFVISLLLISSTLSIGIPVTHYETKCMIVYTVGESESVKVNVKLPEIPNKQQHEGYEIAILNTETNEETVEISNPGTYKRELSLSQNIIYEICFRLQTDRDMGQVIIQYTAQNLFNIQHSQIKVPDNLLKSGDFKQAYQHAQKLLTVTQKFTDLQSARKQTQSETFVKTNQINTNLMYISVIEIAIIIVASAYQYFTLRKYLAGKQYI